MSDTKEEEQAYFKKLLAAYRTRKSWLGLEKETANGRPVLRELPLLAPDRE